MRAMSKLYENNYLKCAQSITSDISNKSLLRIYIVHTYIYTCEYTYIGRLKYGISQSQKS